MTAPICSFCGTSIVKARRLVHSDDGAAAICGACIIKCTEMLSADPKPDAPKAEGEAPAANFPRNPSVSLENFLGTANWWVSCHTPPDVQAFAYEFLKAYAAAVRGIADAPRHQSYEAPNGDAAVEAAFEELMAPYRRESRRSYLGAAFSAILGTSIRQAFRDHVALSTVRYGERSNASGDGA